MNSYEHYEQPRFSLSDVFNAYDELVKQERGWCEAFCALNSGEANEQRRREADLIVSGIFRMKLELESLNRRREGKE